MKFYKQIQPMIIIQSLKNCFLFYLKLISILNRLLKGLQFSFLCRMDSKEAIERASALFKSIPVEYFNGSNVDIK
jgi:hypothetical protein